MKKFISSLVALSALAATPVYAADTKISALPSATAPTGPEQIPGVQSAATVKFTIDQFAGLVRPIYKAGRWYAPPMSVTGGAAMTADTVRFTPFMPLSRMTVSDVGIRITTVSASGHIRLGFYAAGTGLYPTSTPLSSCVVVTDSAGVVSCTLGANVSFNAGTIYYFAAQADNSTVVANAINASSTPMGASQLIGDSQGIGNVSTATSQLLTCYGASMTYAGGLTDATTLNTSWSAPISAANTQCPYTFFKVTSVP